MDSGDSTRRTADLCSAQWDEAALPVWGTAAVARFWIALEQPGPWGLDALTQSRLDPGLAHELDHRCLHHGGRLVLIRRPGGSRPPGSGPRTVYLAAQHGSRAWLATGEIDDPTALLTLPFHALGLGRATADDVSARVPSLHATDGGVVLVCTNGKRDLCCAVRGRPVALQAERQRPGRVWECSHTGGHRFSPTGVVLPFGHTVAGVTSDLVVAAVDAADHGRLEPRLLGPVHDRGSSALVPPLQAAVAWARVRSGSPDAAEADPAALTARFADDDGSLVDVEHLGGRSWRVRITERRYDAPLKNSCAKPPGPVSSWHVEEVS